MITVIEKNSKLIESLKQTKLNKLNSLFVYKIHPIHIKYNIDKHLLISYDRSIRRPDYFNCNLKKIKSLFRFNDIKIVVDDFCGCDGIYIGIRNDIINCKCGISLCSSIISTIVYGLENRINFDKFKDFKIKNIPEFKYVA